MSTFQFGVVTSAYTVGGLIASLNAGDKIGKWGQKKTAERAAWATLIVSFHSSSFFAVSSRSQTDTRSFRRVQH